MRKLALLIVFITLSSFLAVIPLKNVFATNGTMVRVEPPTSIFYANATPVGTTFAISIIAENVPSPGFYGWELYLSWTPSVIDCTTQTLDTAIWTPYNTWVPTPIDNVAGTYHQAMTGQAPATPAVGTFWLVNLTFTIVATPLPGQTLETPLTISPAAGATYCLGDMGADEIPHDFSHGLYKYIGPSAPPPPPPPAAGHDIAVAKLELAKTMMEQNYTLPINVTIANLGNDTEIFDVRVNISSTTIKVFSSVTLQKGLNTTLTLEWNSTGTAKGNYTITAYASPVTNETNTVDNQLSAWVFVTIRGDINGDKIVNGEDAVKMGTSFGSLPGSEKWNNDADLNNDSYVNFKDIILLGGNFGKSWS
jgi:hypothetical protein